MSATAEAAPQARRMPPWMSMPGSPPRPDYSTFGRKMSQLSEEKRRLFDEIKTLQSSLRGDETRDIIDVERKELHEKMNDIVSQRSRQKELRDNKNDEIAKARKQKREVADKLRALQTELGGFDDLKDIDAAIDYVIKKMETSGGGLAAEKRTVKRLHQLEEAKSLLLEMQPLTEAIEEATERENMLQREYREIHERIGVLNKDYEERLKVKQSKDKDALKSGADRSAIYTKCDEIRTRITKINEDMNQMREVQNKLSADWDAWCTEARTKYAAKVEAEQAERHRQYLERKNASKMTEKMDRARQRQNPHEVEINACDTLVLYLKNKKHMLQREEEQRRKRDAAATFNPSSAAPSGFVMMNDSQWSNAKPLNKAAKKQQQKQQMASASSNAAIAKANKGEQSAMSKPKGVMQHPEEMMRMLQMIAVEPPVSADAIDGKINEIRERQKEFQSQINKGELVLSSDDDESEDEQHNDGDHTDNKASTPTTTADSKETEERGEKEKSARSAAQEAE